MFSYSEYDVHEHYKQLLHDAEQSRLAKQARSAKLRPAERVGNQLLSLGARLVTPDDCETITTGAGYTVRVCSDQAA